ncbi:YjbH domain-containing protein [Colwellia sp. MB02u-18]|uniref:YjbH domain-containing protein n=1 Tax=unclassified Colwellia TaxID=196834 RepID=UPI0015F67B73|nr:MULTISPECIES: YjbH domain-containing protein [unclassified Colwellia]MBA6223801.1 YjbH domain-containing protein [Colwellia sp. MB3u-45]MBA6265957.1 YjbH domain-containing protein [Colwellia sp. MB3u-43]MBA6319982.1 YjbH domain-containing protein [Colwellia sp. MB02u-19]MBA6324474.1 YjbH domain-containing protein [Colwellia sp. MB02u-18]MBA6330629.1 YjbH domain-containing protein [Colwellia sp. MB02u-12]
MTKLNTVFLGGLVALSAPIMAADKLNSFQSLNGYTGLINTPSAQAQAKGTVDIGYNNQLDFRGNKYIDGHNFIFSAGLFKGFEVSGQIAANSMNDNFFYSEGKGQTRDLSFNAKYQLPFIPNDWFSLALGGKDIGGAANNYATYYAVASKQIWDFRFSAGIATSERLTGQMDGVFAGVEWQLFDWFSLQVEHDGEAENAAARITLPKKWLFDVGTLTLTSRFYSNSAYDEQGTYWGLNLTIPLFDDYDQPTVNSKSAAQVQRNHAAPTYGVKQNKPPGFSSFAPRAAAPVPLVAPAPVTTTAASKNTPSRNTMKVAAQATALQITAADTALNTLTLNKLTLNKLTLNTQAFSLKAALAADGFENILVGYNQQKQLIIQFENPVFNRNDIDAFGLVLGRIAEHVTEPGVEFNVQLAKYDTPLMSILGQVDNYRAFINGQQNPDLAIHQGVTAIPKGVTWVGLTRANSPYFKPRVTISPALTNTYATELGVIDFSLALRADIDLPLWQGGGVSVSGQVHVANSDDFEKTAPFKRYREHTGVDRAVFYQTFALPFGLYNQTQVGYFQETYDYSGIINETAWLSPAGRHKVSANVGYFVYQNYNGNRDYKTMSYQYNWVEQNITFHATAGEFWSTDTGAKLESRFWFGDSYIGLFYENTSAQKAGVSISIPLTSRKDMAVTRYGQIKGKEAWRHTASTQIGKSHNRLVFNQGYTPGTAISLDRSFFNQGRMSSDYIYANLARLKNAYMEYK